MSAKHRQNFSLNPNKVRFKPPWARARIIRQSSRELFLGAEKKETYWLGWLCKNERERERERERNSWQACCSQRVGARKKDHPLETTLIILNDDQAVPRCVCYVGRKAYK